MCLMNHVILPPEVCSATFPVASLPALPNIGLGAGVDVNAANIVQVDQQQFAVPSPPSSVSPPSPTPFPPPAEGPSPPPLQTPPPCPLVGSPPPEVPPSPSPQVSSCCCLTLRALCNTQPAVSVWIIWQSKPCCLGPCLHATNATNAKRHQQQHECNCMQAMVVLNARMSGNLSSCILQISQQRSSN